MNEKYFVNLSGDEIEWIFDMIERAFNEIYEKDEIIMLANFYQKLEREKKYYDEREDNDCI